MHEGTVAQSEEPTVAARYWLQYRKIKCLLRVLPSERSSWVWASFGHQNNNILLHETHFQLQFPTVSKYLFKKFVQDSSGSILAGSKRDAGHARS